MLGDGETNHDTSADHCVAQVVASFGREIGAVALTEDWCRCGEGEERERREEHFVEERGIDGLGLDFGFKVVEVFEIELAQNAVVDLRSLL